MELGDHQGAREVLERARDILEEGEFPELPDVLIELAELDYREGEFEAALAGQSRAAALWREALGEDNPQLAVALTRSGIVLCAAGRTREALAPLERALVLRSAASIDPFDRGETRFALAQALGQLPAGRGGELARARELATDALEDYRKGGERAANERAEVERWLADHPL